MGLGVGGVGVLSSSDRSTTSMTGLGRGGSVILSSSNGSTPSVTGLGVELEYGVRVMTEPVERMGVAVSFAGLIVVLPRVRGNWGLMVMTLENPLPCF